MVKAFDISLVADRSLDLYCESVAENYPPTYGKSPKSRHVSPSVMKVFRSVMDEAVGSYSSKYDLVFAIVPCYPITRMRSASIITRFICRNPGILHEMGVGSNQFLEMFEKFISSLCDSEYVSRAGNGAFVLNGRRILGSDWKDAILRRYGSSLVDLSVEHPFLSNPGFITSMESDLATFDPTGDDVKFRLDEILGRIG